jgi:hypothetical protein
MRDTFHRMRLRAFAPDTFSLGLLALGVVLMAFPSLRVAGLIALILAVVYWLLMAMLKVGRR